MALLDTIQTPADLRILNARQLEELAAEIREFLVSNVSRTGGHLGPNLGAVELTLALHRVFDSPSDPIIFDTGHQSYVHKMVTGRAAQFPSLRQRGGLSGYPSRRESEHDWVESSHASSALSWAEGLAQGFHLQQMDRTVVAVVGDGSLTGGMAWEALNNIADHPELRLVIVVNDNGRSYNPTVGGLANHLTRLRTNPRYEQTLDIVKRKVAKAPFGRPVYEMLHGVKTGVKDVLAPQGMFSDLNLKYLGPIDGHDLTTLEEVLQQARGFHGPVIVHCITQKGRGFRAAERDERDRLHAVGQINELTGEPLAASSAVTWTDVFSAELLRLADADPRIVALTAAMLHPTGLGRFAAAHPDRVFDVGIAEQHALTSAAGLAAAGMRPVVAIYSTFLNRAFDQLLMDAALHELPVTIVLDRSGITGPDGASHHGMWDVSLAGMVPGLRLAAPRDARRLADALGEAVTATEGPSVIRYSKEKLPDPINAVTRHQGVDLLATGNSQDVLLVAYGQFAALGLQVAQRLSQHGIGVTVADPLWALPVSAGLVDLAEQHTMVVSIEDSLVTGGLGWQLQGALNDHGASTLVHCWGIPKTFIDHASRAEVLDELGLTASEIARAVTERYLARPDSEGLVEDERSGLGSQQSGEQSRK